MYIKNLPQEIQDRVRVICPTASDDDKLQWVFSWMGTKEGDKFWRAIHNGNFDVFYDRKKKIDLAIERVDKQLKSLREKQI